MSEKIRVLLVKNFFEKDIEYIRARLLDSVEIIRPSEFTPETIAQAVKDNIHVVLGEPKTKAILDNASSLKLIQIPWTGVDRLNFDLLKQYPFLVCNSHSNARIVAEYAVAMMFAIAKRLAFHDRYLRRGKWCRPTQQGENLFFPPEPVYQKTIVIIGYGAIGRNIAEMLAGFSAKIIAIDVKPCNKTPQPLYKLLGPEKMPDAAAQADFLFTAVPLTEHTRGMINKNVFEKMKSTAYFINTSRGEVVVEEDLYNVLKNRRIAGAAIDTWYNYPKASSPDALPSLKFPFHELDNLVLSPHRAGFARGAMPHLDDAIENINRFAAGKELINIVDLNAGF
ncbi:MAG: hypothetical protein JW804_02595 [Sedimentisphaerales bacterium]|nr:hypothetical protein [Sedimentisphaerales bacterium]